jgi:tetratricopeptide (TPR) repeat protein
VGELRAEGIRLQQRGDLAGAMARYREAIQVAQQHGLKPALAANRIAVATVHITEERYEDAAAELGQAVGVARKIRNRIEAATALAYLGQARRLQGRMEEAVAALRESLELTGTTPSRPRALAHFQMGEVHRARGDQHAALAEYREAHAVLRELDDAPAQAAILISIGRTQAALSDPAAVQALGQARDLLRRLGLSARAAEVEAEIAALSARR